MDETEEKKATLPDFSKPEYAKKPRTMVGASRINTSKHYSTSETSRNPIKRKIRESYNQEQAPKIGVPYGTYSSTVPDGKKDGHNVLLEVSTRVPLQYNQSTDKILDYALIKLTSRLEENDPIVIELTRSKYMDLVGIKDKKQATKDLRNATILGSSVWSRVYEDEQSTKFQTVVPFKQANYGLPKDPNERTQYTKKGTLVMVVSQDFINELRNPNNKDIVGQYFIRKMFQVKGDAYYIGKMLINHLTINRGQKQENRLRLGTIWEHIPNKPTWEQMIESKRSYNRISDFFDKQLKILKEAGIITAYHFEDKVKERNTEDITSLDPANNFFDNMLVIDGWGFNIDLIAKRKPKGKNKNIETKS